MANLDVRREFISKKTALYFSVTITTADSSFPFRYQGEADQETETQPELPLRASVFIHFRPVTIEQNCVLPL